MQSGGVSPLTSSLAASRTATPSGSKLNSNGNGAAPKTRICVYCGSSPGSSPVHMEAARALGTVMAEQGIELVYGGGTVGLMGEVAKTMVAISGPESVHGIIPEALVKFERDSTYSSTTDANGYHLPEEQVYGKTEVVENMHTRKQRMAEQVIAGGPGSGFIALSGGFGTIEELMEMTTWNQLGIHTNGVCVLNIGGFYDGILQWLKTAVEQGFIRKENAGILVTAEDAAGAVEALRNYRVSEARLKLAWASG